MKKFSVLLILILLAQLWADDFVNLSWNNPQISSRYQSSWLDKNPDENLLITRQMKPDQIALSSLGDAWKNYIDKTDDSSFLRLNIPLQAEQAQLDLRFYGGLDIQHNFASEENFYFYNY